MLLYEIKGIKLLCHVVAEQLPDCPASRSLREFVQNNAVTYQAPGQIKADPSQTVGLLCNAVAEQSESRFSQSSQDYTQNTLNAGPDTSSRRQGSSPSGGRPPNESYQLRRAPSKTKPISPTTTSSRQITGLQTVPEFFFCCRKCLNEFVVVIVWKLKPDYFIYMPIQKK